MATRRTERLIRQIRNDTGNQDYSSTEGISQTDIVEYLNSGQARIQSLILTQHPRGAFIREGFLDVVARTESVTLPSDMLEEGGVKTLEFSQNGGADNYYALAEADLAERRNSYYGNPSRYLRRENTVLLYPIPQSNISNALRCNYVYRLPRIDVRRGQVSAVTLNTGAKTITSLTLTTGATLDSVGLLEDDFITVVSSAGTIKMKAIPISAVNTVTGVVTVDTFVYATGETIAVGDYVVSGKNSTSHSQLPETLERYLIEYGRLRVLQRDSNNDVTEQSAAVTALEDEIVGMWAQYNDDVIRIPEINESDF